MTAIMPALPRRIETVSHVGDATAVGVRSITAAWIGRITRNGRESRGHRRAVAIPISNAIGKTNHGETTTEANVPAAPPTPVARNGVAVASWKAQAISPSLSRTIPTASTRYQADGS